MKARILPDIQLILLQHGSTRRHTTAWTTSEVHRLDYPSCSAELAASDFHIFSETESMRDVAYLQTLKSRQRWSCDSVNKTHASLVTDVWYKIRWPTCLDCSCYFIEK
jgi:hypothetical protein